MADLEMDDIDPLSEEARIDAIRHATDEELRLYNEGYRGLAKVLDERTASLVVYQQKAISALDKVQEARDELSQVRQQLHEARTQLAIDAGLRAEPEDSRPRGFSITSWQKGVGQGEGSSSKTVPPSFVSPASEIGGDRTGGLLEPLVQPFDRPSKYPEAILWSSRDPFSDEYRDTRQKSASNQHHIIVEKIWRNEDGTIIESSRNNEIRKILRVSASEAIALLPADKREDYTLWTTSYLEVHGGAAYRDVLARLEATLPFLSLCASHWKATESLGSVLRNRRNDAKRTRKGKQGGGHKRKREDKEPSAGAAGTDGQVERAEDLQLDKSPTAEEDRDGDPSKQKKARSTSPTHPEPPGEREPPKTLESQTLNATETSDEMPPPALPKPKPTRVTRTTKRKGLQSSANTAGSLTNTSTAPAKGSTALLDKNSKVTEATVKGLLKKLPGLASAERIELLLENIKAMDPKPKGKTAVRMTIFIERMLEKRRIIVPADFTGPAPTVDEDESGICFGHELYEKEGWINGQRPGTHWEICLQDWKWVGNASAIVRFMAAWLQVCVLAREELEAPSQIGLALFESKTEEVVDILMDLVVINPPQPATSASAKGKQKAANEPSADEEETGAEPSADSQAAAEVPKKRTGRTVKSRKQ